VNDDQKQMIKAERVLCGYFSFVLSSFFLKYRLNLGCALYMGKYFIMAKVQENLLF